MGLRTASVRRPRVGVMAPALTDTNQAQNFKLSRDSPDSDEAICVIPKVGIVKGKELADVLDNLNTLAYATDLLKPDNLVTLSEASENNPEPSTMNNSPTLMGDQQMGLEKTGLDNISDVTKDKSAASEVDQLFNNLSSDLPVSDMGVGSEIGQNVEEIMQVIKSIEGSGGSAPSDMGGESDPIFPLSGSDLTNNLPNFDKLFNDVDMMNVSMEEQLSEATSPSKETQTKELIADVERKQAKLERKLEFLLRRLRKFQIHSMGVHFSNEIGGIFEHVHRTLKRVKDSFPAQTSYDDSNSNPLQPIEPAPPIPPEKMKPLSYGSAKSLVKKLEMSSMLQANASSRQRHTARYFGSGSIESTPYKNNAAGMLTLPPWPTEQKQELQKLAGTLQAQFKLAQEELDSEATASSSGGESCDESQNYNNPHQHYLSM